MRRLALVLTVLLGAVCAPRPGAAHPHVWVTAASELVYGGDGAVTGVRHAWTFDDMFSTYALQGIETKTKGVYTREELAPLAQTNVESLREFGFFTFAKAGDPGAIKKHRFSEPVDYYLEHRNGGLVLHFTLPFRSPVKAKELAVEVFDPSYFVDFSMEEKDPVKLVNAPEACKMTLQRPNPATATPPPMNESNFASGDNSNYGAMFANKIVVTCP
jgi:ABC-type uncharacterized transport system substrate-binding protein